MRWVSIPLPVWVNKPIMAVMEQFIREIEAYAQAAQRKPQAVLRAAVGASWKSWDSWLSRRSSPTMAVADRIRDYMRANPPQRAGSERDAA